MCESPSDLARNGIGAGFTWTRRLALASFADNPDRRGCLQLIRVENRDVCGSDRGFVDRYTLSGFWNFALHEKKELAGPAQPGADDAGSSEPLATA